MVEPNMGETGRDDPGCHNPYPAGVLPRIQERLLAILSEIDRVCTTHGLVYWLDSGSALGSVRDGGMIPWDDDIDIGMPYADYLEFCKVAPLEFGSGFTLRTPLNTGNYAALWAKACDGNSLFLSRQVFEAGTGTGFFVDIFPYCRVPSDEHEARRQIAAASRWQKISYLYNSAHPKIPQGSRLRTAKVAACGLAHWLFRVMLTQEGIARRFGRVFTEELALTAMGNRYECGSSASGWVCASYSTMGVFRDGVLLPTGTGTFGGRTYPLPGDAEGYLDLVYPGTPGWREYPPPDKRYGDPPIVVDFGDGVNVMS